MGTRIAGGTAAYRQQGTLRDMLETVRHFTSKTARQFTLAGARNASGEDTRHIRDLNGLVRTGSIDARVALALLEGRGLSGNDAARAAALAGVARERVLLTWGTLTNRIPMHHLANELRMRGAHVDIMRNDHIAFADGVLRYKGKVTAVPEAVIGRGVRDEFLPEFQRMQDSGLFMVNGPAAIMKARGKVAQATVFAEHAIPTPQTSILRSADDLRAAAVEFGYPFVLKADRGSGGVGVFKVSDAAELEKYADELLAGPDAKAMVAQEMLTPGRDVRVFVVRDAAGEHQAVTAVERMAAGSDFRANSPAGSRVRGVARDGSEPALSLAGIQNAKRAAQAFDLDIAGVDLSVDGKVFEVNATPGIPELDATLPRAEHALPHIADRAIYGAAPS